MPSIAAAVPAQQPLADALEQALRAVRNFDFDAMRQSIDDAKAHCASL